MSSKQITIRMPEAEAEAFRRACEESDLTASQVLRRAAREFVRESGQGDLFSGGKSKSRAKR